MKTLSEEEYEALKLLEAQQMPHPLWSWTDDKGTTYWTPRIAYERGWIDI